MRSGNQTQRKYHSLRHLTEGHLEEAIAQYRAALKSKPEIAEFHNTLGIALALTGCLDEAMAQFKEALRLKPDYAAARANLTKASAALAGRRSTIF